MSRETLKLKLRVQPSGGWLKSLVVIAAIAFPAARPLPAVEECNYIAEDKIGYFTVHVDGLRLFEASYKGINLLSQWGEFYAGTKDQIYGAIYDYPKKIMVRTNRGKGETEYVWSCGDAEKGYRQANRVVTKPEKIVSDITLEITRDVPREIKFHPVLFPGYRVSYNRGERETRILGKECEVVRNNGERYKIAYTNDPGEFAWLTDDTREVVFNLRDNKIRYSFSSTDPSMKLSFKGNAKFRTNLTRPVIEGEMTLSPTGQPYQVTLHMELAVGKEAEEKMLAAEKVPFGDDVEIKTSSEKMINLFPFGEKPKLDVTVDNAWNEKDRDLALEIAVKDYSNKTVYKTEKAVKIKSKGKENFSLDLPLENPGIFALKIEAQEQGKPAGKGTTRFGIAPPAAQWPTDKSMFGVNFGAFQHGAWHPATQKTDFYPYLDKVSRTLHTLGVKRVRLVDHLLRWVYVEKEQGKFQFDPASQKIVDTIRANGIDVYYSGYIFEERYPEWALSEKDYAIHGDNDNSHVRQRWPKDFTLYENYMYEVMQHMKGRIHTIELDNEPQFSDVKMKAEFYKAAYQGIKRADPDCVVIGATIADTSAKCLDWLEALLVETGGKNMDMIGFHYPYGFCFGTEPPESPNLEANVKRLIEIAKKNHLRLMDGEDGKGGNYRNFFPHGEFQDSEKDFVNLNLRTYLLTMMHPEIEHISPCHAAAPFGLLWEPCNQYSVEFGSTSFWQIGGTVSPWGIAHAVLASLFEGAKFEERLNLSSAGVYCLVFKDKRGAPLIAMWAPNINLKADIPVSPSSVQVIATMGEEKAFKGKNISLALTSEPVYIRGNRSEDFDKITSLLKQTALSIPKDAGTEGMKKAVETDFFYSLDGKRAVLVLKNNVDLALKVDSIAFKFASQPPIMKKGFDLKGNEIEKIGFEIPTNLLHESKGLNVAAEITIGGNTFSKSKHLTLPSEEEARKNGLLIARMADTPPTLSGKEEEYQKAVPIVIDKEENVIIRKEGVSRKDIGDLSATAYLLYDETNLYFAAMVKDDKYVNTKTGRDSWNGDSIQIAMDTLNDSLGYTLNVSQSGYDNNDFEINLALTKDGPYQSRRSFGNSLVSADGPIPGARLNITLKEGGLFYEIAIPFKELAPLVPGLGREMRFNFIVNDDDGEGRNKWIGITGGIGEKKDPSLYKKIIFMK